MKRNIKTLVLGLLTAILATGCVGDDDFSLPPFDDPAWQEDFQTATDGTTLDIVGWTNFAERGNKRWNEEVFSGNGYAEFSTFNSGDASNVGWLITPAINLDGTGKVLLFQTAQHHLEVAANKMEVFVSTDFDGENVTGATWIPLTAALPNADTEWYEFVPSGRISLAAYSGNVHIAFKVTGSGTDVTLDGAYQIDNVKILK